MKTEATDYAFSAPGREPLDWSWVHYFSSLPTKTAPIALEREEGGILHIVEELTVNDLLLFAEFLESNKYTIILRAAEHAFKEGKSPYLETDKNIRFIMSSVEWFRTNAVAGQHVDVVELPVETIRRGITRTPLE